MFKQTLIFSFSLAVFVFALCYIADIVTYFDFNPMHWEGHAFLVDISFSLLAFIIGIVYSISRKQR